MDLFAKLALRRFLASLVNELAQNQRRDGFPDCPALHGRQPSRHTQRLLAELMGNVVNIRQAGKIDRQSVDMYNLGF